MKWMRSAVWVMVVVTCFSSLLVVRKYWPSAQQAQAQEPTSSLPAFQLPDATGREVKLADYRDKEALIVVFLGTECPLAKLAVLRMKEMHQQYAPQGVQVLGIFSNSQDSAEDVQKFVKKHDLPFPALIDAEQKVADLFGAERTPEAFLLDSKNVIRYRGRIDDRYSVGGDRGEPTRKDLEEALKEVMAGKAVSVAKTDAVGCKIGRAKPRVNPKDVTYAKHVAGLMQSHCQDCHRPGQVGPFSLLTYDDARDWSGMIREVVSDGRMPPWHADPRHGSFANDRSLPAADRDLLVAWIDNGCPKGDARDMPPPRQFPEGWLIGKPDMVLKMKEPFKIPAESPKGGIPYQHFVVMENVEQELWIQGIEARPGNPAVVHHMLIYVGEPPSRGMGLTDREMIGGYVPGSRPAVYPAGFGKRVPKGSKVMLEMHYTANGTETTDLSSVGLILAKEPPRHEVMMRFVDNRDFAIPPKVANHEVKAVTVFEQEAVILTVGPHMHLRGKDFLFRVVYPDGRKEILLSVPRYDFNWQHTYALKEPLKVPAGTKIECVAHFDNSAANPNNPDPNAEVRWGDQSWEEMMLGLVGYFYPSE